MTVNKEIATIYLMNLFTSFLALTLLTSPLAEAKCAKRTVKIAVLDTGFGYNDLGHDANLCKYEHMDFSVEKQFTSNYNTKTSIPLDIHSHGTNVTGLIDRYARRTKVDYCIVIVKYFSDNQSGDVNLWASQLAWEYAIKIKADIVNYSGGGPCDDDKEKALVKRFLDQGGKVVAAAGNEAQNLNVRGNSYCPAQADPRVIVVGNHTATGSISQFSNYGKQVTRWEIGVDQEVYGIKMTGTSQATAIATGKIVAEMQNKCDRGF